MKDKKRAEFNLRTMFFPYRDRYDGDKIKFVGHRSTNELEATTGEGILVAAFTVAILAGCGILAVILWASQQPIY